MITALCGSVQNEIEKNRAEIKAYSQQVALRASIIRELKQEYEKKVYDLFTLFDVAQQLNSTLDQKKISQTMILTCMGQMGVSASMVFQLEEYIEYKLHMCDVRGIEIPHAEDFKLDVGSPFIKRILSSGKGVLLETVEQEFGNDEMFKKLKELHMVLLVPFIEKNEIKVAMGVGPKLTGEQFTHDDIEFLSILTNMGGLALRNAKLYTMTITDGLTKLYLPRYFVLKAEEEVKRATRYHQSLGMLMIDIDDFKRINDTYGHLEGNRILQEMAEILVRGGRDTHIVARYGGEEFAVIMPMTDRKAGLIAADRIRKLVEQKPFQMRGAPITITISIGLAVFPDDGKTSHQILDCADTMLYQAKAAGKNRVASTENAPPAQA
jgi:diguanylate cyclase (GGDEF)-like protein